MKLTAQEKELARHALGLNCRRSSSYRNRFVTGPGTGDYNVWIDMVVKGLATRSPGSQLTGGDDLFMLTRRGAEAALAPGESLCPEDFPATRAEATP